MADPSPAPRTGGVADPSPAPTAKSAHSVNPPGATVSDAAVAATVPDVAADAAAVFMIS